MKKVKTMYIVIPYTILVMVSARITEFSTAKAVVYCMVITLTWYILKVLRYFLNFGDNLRDTRKTAIIKEITVLVAVVATLIYKLELYYLNLTTIILYVYPLIILIEMLIMYRSLYQQFSAYKDKPE